MERKRVPLGLLVIVVLLMGAGAAHARPRMDPQPAARAAEHGFLERAWSWMIALIGHGGSSMDPSGGQSEPNQPPGNGNVANELDPLG